MTKVKEKLKITAEKPKISDKKPKIDTKKSPIDKEKELSDAQSGDKDWHSHSDAGWIQNVMINDCSASNN